MDYENRMPIIEENISQICSSLRTLVSRIDTLKSKAFELSIKGDDIAILRGQKIINFSEHLNILNLNLQGVVKNITTCEEITDVCFKDLTQILPWLPDNKNDLEVLFVEGNSPWSFWVTYHDTSEVEVLHKTLEEKLEGGTLKAVVKCPQVGTFVCCLDRKLFFRGLVIGVLPDERLKILGVDSKCIKLAKLENVYEMSKDLCKFHANAVHCCLTEDSTAQDLWNEDLSGVFKSTLRECKLKMNVLYEVECFPPKFLVEISGHNEPMKVNVNINKWVCQQLLPEIKKVEEMSKEVDLITLLSEDALDPYSCLSEYDIKVPPREESKKGNTKGDFTRTKYISEKISKEYNEAYNKSKESEKKGVRDQNTYQNSSFIGLKEEANEFIPDRSFNCYGIYQNDHPRISYVGSANYVYNKNTASYPSQSNFLMSQSYSPLHQPYRVNYSQSNQWWQPITPAYHHQPYYRTFPERTAMTQTMPELPVHLPIPPKHKHTSYSLKKKDKNASVQEAESNVSVPDAETGDESKQNSNPSPSNFHSQSEYESKFSLADTNKAEGGLCIGSLKSWTDSCDEFLENTVVNEAENSKAVKGRCNDQHVESALEHHIIAEEEACIISEYYPTDETRICQFYAKRGFCWKVGCTKEHSDPSIGDKWTTDKISVFKEPFNRIAMPDVGDIIDLQVTYVSSGNCFFALLPDKYSDIGEFTEREPETLDGLTNALNLPQTIKNFQYLEADPCLGELILALSASGSWLRARVCELFDTAVEVYYVDYGTTETIPNSKKRLRKISPEFLHLPFQAVLCFLADLSVSEDEMLKEKGLNYLENLLLGKIVQGKLVSRSVLDSELQLVIWAAGGINVNEVMVHKGFCSKF